MNGSEGGAEVLTGDIMSAEADKPALKTDPVTVKLIKPIMVIENMIDTVTITPPTGRHLMKAGAVVRLMVRDDETFIEVQQEGMGKLISACCNIPLRSVEMMAGSDFMSISGEIMGFLGQTTS